jgi:hypothetical protein
LTSKWSFKTMIITTFILFWLMSTWFDPPNTWLGLYLGLTIESGFKTMIVTTFVFMLNRVTDQSHSWPGPCPISNLESSFKTLIITIFILMLTRANPMCDSGQPELWLGLQLVTQALIQIDPRVEF